MSCIDLIEARLSSMTEKEEALYSFPAMCFYSYVKGIYDIKQLQESAKNMEEKQKIFLENLVRAYPLVLVEKVTTPEAPIPEVATPKVVTQEVVTPEVSTP
jgi:hypothetical protein